MKKLLLILLTLPILATAQTISTVAGTGSGGFSGDGGNATAAKINSPYGIVKDAAGNFYIADRSNNRIRKISPLGIITTFAGTGAAGHSGDSGPATAAQINSPFLLAFDAVGNMYFCESGNYIRKINISGVISTVAGTGTSGSSGDGGPATTATFNSPQGLAFDAAGNMYVADCNNNRVRKINAAGIISAYAGSDTAGYMGDTGPATACRLKQPNFLSLDHAGNLYISDDSNYCVRKVTTSGIITTFAGTGSVGSSGDGGPATAAHFNHPGGIAVDSFGNVYIADQLNNRVRRVDTLGIIQTIAGTGAAGYGGDGGPATAATLYSPNCPFIDQAGNLYISDNGNNRIRKVNLSPTYTTSSFNIFVDKYCHGPQIRVVPHTYAAGMYVITYYGDGGRDSAVVGTTGSAYFSHNYPNSGLYTVRQILHTASSAIDTFTFDYDHALCNSIAVKYYYDANNNCHLDGTDRMISEPMVVEIDSNGIAIDTLSVTSGLNYLAYGSTGDVYGFKIVSTPTGFDASCPATGIVFDTLNASMYSTTKYVGMLCNNSTNFDLKIHAIAPATGVNDQMGGVYVENAFCQPQAATITMHRTHKYDGPTSAGPSTASFTSDLITWTIPSLSANLGFPLYLSYNLNTVPGTLLTPGDTVHNYFTIDPTIGDSDTSDNHEIVVDTIKAGCDPNEMWVKPAGCIPYSPAPVQLQYTINFENTGNDTAHNIYVMDTLSDFVDPTGMRLVMVSKEMYVTKIRDAAGHNILKFDFPHINLLDSSHHGQCDGAFIYTINTRAGVPSGANIANRAGIYFDINNVVMTNEVDNGIGCADAVAHNSVPEAEGPVVYPNPASNQLTIKVDNSLYNFYSIANSMGETITKNNLSASQTSVKISSLPAGLYFVNISGPGGMQMLKFVKL